MNKLDLIMKKMEEIKYTDNTDSDFSKNYRLKSPEEVINDKNGVCWDQVELERFYFEKDNINCTSYFIVEYDNKEFPTHTFMVVKDKNNYYWFEHSWEPYRGIHVYKSLNDLLTDVKNKFCKNRDINRTLIYKYQKPQYGISGEEFFNHCENGIKIDLKEEL